MVTLKNYNIYEEKMNSSQFLKLRYNWTGQPIKLIRDELIFIGSKYEENNDALSSFYTRKKPKL